MGDVTNETIEVFKEALLEDNISVQVDAIKRLSILAASLDSTIIREELIPVLNQSIDALNEEVSYYLAEELVKIVDNENVGAVVELLVKLASEDETLVRERAITSLRSISDTLSPWQCESIFIPLIGTLINGEWFTTKCSAGFLIPICYPKISTEKQNELLNVFRNLIQDSSPLVRRSCATSLTDFIPLTDTEISKSEFVPIFDNLSLDVQDSVRTIAVDVGVALSKKMKDFEIYDFLINTFKILCEDDSWRVRQNLASKISELSLTEKIRDEIFNIFIKLSRDNQSEVRVLVAKNIFPFSQNWLQTYDSDGDQVFVEKLLPDIQELLQDSNDEVRVTLSTNILSLSSILGNGCFIDNILPPIINAIENEENMVFRENILKNLNSLPNGVEITQLMKSVSVAFSNLLENSQTHWRTRRNLLVALIHTAQNTDSEYFTKNIKFFYKALLSDRFYGIRRLAPVILPLLVKRFGVAWAKTELFPVFAPFAVHPVYLFRYVTLYAIEELITPTLDTSVHGFLDDFKEFTNQEANKALSRIVVLNSLLLGELEEIDSEIDNICDDLAFYAEDMLDTLKHNATDIFQTSLEEVNDSYLEGVLFMLVKDFVKVLKILSRDPVANVQEKTQRTFSKVKEFSLKICKELEQDWVQSILCDIDFEMIQIEVEERLEQGKLSVEEFSDNKIDS